MNQFRVGGVYRQRNGIVVKVTHPNTRGMLIVENVFVPPGVDPTHSGGGRDAKTGCYSFRPNDPEWRSCLIPGELHNVGGEWVPISAPNDEGWIEWNGGECPVPEGAKFSVRLRSGLKLFDLDEQYKNAWKFLNDGNDIVAYRVTEPAKAESADLLFIQPADARMIARDGEAKPKAIQPAPEPLSNVKQAIQGLTIERPLTGLVSPGFGSALLG